MDNKHINEYFTIETFVNFLNNKGFVIKFYFTAFYFYNSTQYNNLITS